MKEPRYRAVTDLQSAVQTGEVDPEALTGFICKGELFVRAGTPDDIFTEYYGSARACEDVCGALGITEVEHV